MIKILIAAAGFLIPAASLAGAPAADGAALSGLGDTPAVKAPLVPEPENAAKYWGTIGWLHQEGHQNIFLFLSGGRQFEYSGRKYSLKLGFARGTYEPYISNYKAIQGMLIADVTDLKAAWAYELTSLSVLERDSGRTYFKDAKTPLFNVKYYNGSVYVRTPELKNIVSFSYSDLRTAWSEEAEKYKNYGWEHEKLRYFIPQAYWDSSKSVYRFGFVVSEQAPFYPLSGMPLDFVEVFKASRGIFGEREYKAIAYSIPLGLSLKPNIQDKNWTAYELTDEDLQDALADELEDGEGGFSVLRSAPGAELKGE